MTSECLPDPSANIFASLDDLTVLTVSGADAQTFLQNQLTNDIRRVTPDRAQLSGWCTAKGRLLALFLIWQQADGYRLLLPGAIAEAIRKRLAMFVLRAKVKIGQIDGTVKVFGSYGAEAEALLGQWSGGVPAQPYDTLTQTDGVVIRLPGGRLLVTLPDESATEMLARVSANTGISTARADWETLCIQAGEPQITTGSQEEFVPQQVNLDLLDGVSFKKGCYPGQEIVARTHYLGRIKRRMFHLHADAGAVPAAGEDLYAAETGVASPAGKVVRACAGAQGVELLAVLQLSGESPVHPAERYRLADGSEAWLAPLPYTVLPADH